MRINLTKVKWLLAKIEKADALRLDGQLIHNACNDSDRLEISTPMGDPENEVLLCEYEEEGLCWSFKFTEHNLSEAKLDRFRIRLRDHEGTRVKMFLLKFQRIPIKNR